MKHAMTVSIALLALGCAQTVGAPQGAPEGTTMAARDTALLEPAPNAQGRLFATGVGTDVAIRGDAMFVLSKTRRPEGLADLVFSRDGAFHFDVRPGTVAGTGTVELVDRAGRFVMAYQAVTDPTTRPFGTPPEESVNDLNARLVGPGSGVVRPTAIALDLAMNPDLADTLAFDDRGMMLVGGDAPKDAAGHALIVHLTLAVFSFAQYLKPLEADTYGYQPMAGKVFLGTAANRHIGREVGTTNLIEGGMLERR